MNKIQFDLVKIYNKDLRFSAEKNNDLELMLVVESISSLLDETEKLKQERDALLKVKEELEFYADGKHIKTFGGNSKFNMQETASMGIGGVETGLKAREVLKQCETGVNK